MEICNMNWFQVAEYLKKDDRAIIPLGSTEQHAYLSLCVDYILSSKLSKEAAEEEKLPVFPGLPYGMASYFLEYPGTINISPKTYFGFIEDIFTSLYNQGFRRFVFVNGHGGNSPVQAHLANCLLTHQDAQIVFHNWWSTEAVMQKVESISSVASHASWMENFPWTRLKDVIMPDEEKPLISIKKVQQVSPKVAKEKLIGDGNYGGYYFRDDVFMHQIWDIAVNETKALYKNTWL